MKCTIYSTVLGAIVAVHLVTAAGAQFADPPQTYSFSAIGSMTGSSMTIKVNRNGPRELVERATIAKPGETSKLHDRVLYDFEAHRLFTLDLNSNICTTQEYTSPAVPGLVDPVGAASETVSGIAAMPAQLWTRDILNGIAVKVAELPMAEGQGKSKAWVDEKYGFVVKLAMAMGTEPETTRFEIKEISYAPSPASLFTAPQGCKQIGGTSNANGGHAEMSTEVKAPTQPNVANPAAKVTAVHLRVVPESYVGPCPSQVVLTADITANGPGVAWYRFLAGAVYKNGPAEGTVRFSAAGTKTVTLEGTIRVTPAVGQTSLIAATEDEQGNHGPQTVTSGPVNYNRTCQKSTSEDR